MIILHGWSYGGRIALDVIGTQPRNVVGLALFAPSGSIKDIVYYPTVLYHNVHDTVVDFMSSVSLYKQLKNSTLHSSNFNFDDNNHKCNEFVDTCVDWIMSTKWRYLYPQADNEYHV